MNVLVLSPKNLSLIHILAINAMPKILKIFPNAKLNIWGDKEGGFKRVIHKLVKSLNLDNSVEMCIRDSTTAFMNDAVPELVFAQQINGLGRAGDVFLGISTSGNSKNCLLYTSDIIIKEHK